MDQTGSHDSNTDELVDGGKMMSLLEHLQDLRSVLVKSALAIVAIFFVALTYSEEIIIYLKQPLMAALPKGDLNFTGPMDVFAASIKVSVLTAVLFACPIWLYQFWRFFEPGLYPKERRYILPFIVISVVLFFVGISFCFFLILPQTLSFLIDYGKNVGVPMITINDYLSLVITLILAFGVIFETPVVLVLMAALDLIDDKTLSNNRRVVVVVIFVVAALITPTPDPWTQIAMAAPMYVMFEASIFIVRLMGRKADKNAVANIP